MTEYDQFKSKGVDSIVRPLSLSRPSIERRTDPLLALARTARAQYCIASNDLFVQSAFGRVQKTADKVVCVGDPELKFLEPAGLTQDRASLPFLALSRWRRFSVCEGRELT